MEIENQYQISFKNLILMSWSNMLHQRYASLLQVITISATSAFLTFVICELIYFDTAKNMPGIEYPEGKMVQLLWVLIISLIVCTISNTTTMILNVHKRYREIGTMKCIGAFDITILLLFLVESMILGISGGIIGFIIGCSSSTLSAWINYGITFLNKIVVIQMISGSLLAFFFVVIISILGSAYPAWRASKMLPIEAMKTTQ